MGSGLPVGILVCLSQCVTQDFASETFCSLCNAHEWLHITFVISIYTTVLRVFVHNIYSYFYVHTMHFD